MAREITKYQAAQFTYRLERALREVTNNNDGSERRRVAGELSTSRAEKDELGRNFNALKRENEQLQEMPRTVEDDTTMNISKLGEFFNVKMRLEESRSREAELVVTVKSASEVLLILKKKHFAKEALLEEKLRARL